MCRVLNIFHFRMPLTIYSTDQINFEPHIQRFSELFYWKVMPCNNSETHWNSSNLNFFWYIPVILCESNYFIMLIFKILFLFYFWNLMLFPDINAWETCNQSCVFIMFRIYLNLLNNSGNNISFLCPLLIKILLLPFCNICYGTFFG